jgi:hypothetical protein
VAKDVRRRAPKFSAIPAHDLADALDVPEHWRPGSEWSFTRRCRSSASRNMPGTTPRHPNSST